MGKSLVVTKLLVPPARAGRVVRPRLMARLDEGTRRKLTLLSAPAGYGKTTLVSEWLHQGQRSFAWLSLDEGDDDLAGFLSYLLAALQRVNSRWVQRVHAALGTPALPSAALISALINELAIDGSDVVVILDDYHHIRAEPVHTTLAYLVDHMPTSMHMVIITRVDPPLPLARLRAAGELTEIRATDLRFTSPEASTLLDSITGLRVKPEHVAALALRTEGWVVGLQLAALSLRGLQREQEITRFVGAFAGSHRHVMDYLMEEVFDRQPPPIRAFLLQTAILDRLCGPLCDAVTGQPDGRETLQQLEQANLFTVPLDDKRAWYRYHRLFADLLRGRLRQEQPDRVPELHRRASAWLEREGFAADAFQHAIAGADTERALRLAEENAPQMVRNGELATLLRWMDVLPEELVRSRPQLCVNRGWALFMTGQIGTVGPCLEDAEMALAQHTGSSRSPSDRHEAAVLLSEVTLMRLLLTRFQQDLAQTIVCSRDALQNIDAEDQFARGLLYLNLGIALRRAGQMPDAIDALTEAARCSMDAGNTTIALVATYNLARLYGLLGNLHHAAEICRQVLRAAEGEAGMQMRLSPMLGMAHLGLADVLYEWNDLPAAQAHVEEGIARGEPGGYPGILTNGYTLLARILQARGDAQAARDATERMELSLRQMGAFRSLADELATYRAGLALTQGDLPAATRWAQTVEVPPDQRSDTLGEFMLLTRTRVLLATGHMDDAEELAEELLQSAESDGRVGKAIESLALLALARQARGDDSGALAALGRALELAQPEGYVRTFLDEGAPMVALIRQAAAHGVAPGHATRLLAEYSRWQAETPREPSARFGAGLIAEPLTDREFEVLRLIAAGLSNQNIADRLVISVATVKRHVTNIHGKLGVSRRSQAVARARDLGLL